MTVPINPSCQCQSSCQPQGCGGCCQAGQPAVDAGVWGAGMMQRGCCGIGACTTGCAAPQVQKAAPVVVVDPSHTHRYCHVHDEDKGRTQMVSKLVDRMVETTQVGTRPITRTVKQTVMKKQAQLASRIVQVPSKVRESKEVMKNVTRDVTKTRMVRKQQTRKQTSWVPQTTTQKAWRTVKKTVMHNKTVATIKQLEQQCSCFKQQCGCQGQWNCGCCYPKCGCAPTTTTEYSNIKVPVEVAVNEEYDQPVTRQVAVTKDVTFDVMVPESYTEQETIQVPETVEYDRDIMIPEVQTHTVMVDVPCEEDVTITEHQAFQVKKMVPTKVLVQVREAIPDPECHWHTETHSHPNNDAATGTKHKHADPQP